MTRILIADDHGIVRRGLKEILQDAFPDIYVSEVNDGAELISKVKQEPWDMVISDLTMPGINGLDTVKLLKHDFPNLPVLIVSMHPEDRYAIRALKAGAAGYLTKESASDELVDAVKKVLSGKRYITPSVAEKLADNLEQHATKALHETLSNREFELLKLFASGKTTSEIAAMLSLGVTTVSTYRARILLKMNMKNNAELTHYAITNNLV